VPVTGLVKAFCLLLNVVQSVDDKKPFVEPDAWLIDIVGEVPPLEEIGAVPDTLLTFVLAKAATLSTPFCLHNLVEIKAVSIAKVPDPVIGPPVSPVPELEPTEVTVPPRGAVSNGKARISTRNRNTSTSTKAYSLIWSSISNSDISGASYRAISH